MKKHFILYGILLLLIALFVYTGFDKWIHLSLFKSTIERSPFLNKLSPFITAILPPLEIIIAIALVLKSFRLIALYTAAILMLLFTAYITYMMLFLTRLPCSCAGVFRSLSWSQHLLFNIFFTSIAVTGIYLQRKLNNRYRSANDSTAVTT